MTPYIRYDTGDIGKIYNNIKCACGCNSPVLSLTKGRVHENIGLADGRCINAYIFVYAIEIINLRLERCIKQFSIVQTDYDKFNVKLAVDDDIYELGVSKEAITILRMNMDIKGDIFGKWSPDSIGYTNILK